MSVDEDIRTEGRPAFRCGSCVHYYVTWDKDFPHGCRAMGFKCRSSPSLRVREASGMECQLFVRKEQKDG
jgi:hypothetical protein